ncbi:MAG: 30S ribosomal protein S3, partial [Candidatus Aenigmatarchaeota archaeon]
RPTHAQRPGLVIGRGGSRIKELTSDMEEEFDFENPQIEVDEIEEPDANAQVVAKSMADWLEKGGRAKRVGYTYLRRVREAGAIGAEIEVSGKLSGNRGRTEKFSFGYVKRCGDTSRQHVDRGYSLARTKPGAIGVKVRIMKSMPEFKHRDVDVEEEILHETIEHDEGEDSRGEKIDKVLAEAENMTAAEIDRAAEETGVELEDITVEEIRDAFEEREEEETGSEAEENESEEPETSEADYEEIVSGTISDAKDALEELDSPDYAAALEAEKDNKNRTTFIDWLESRVNA